jgi:hypothetical protein
LALGDDNLISETIEDGNQLVIQMLKWFRDGNGSYSIQLCPNYQIIYIYIISTKKKMVMVQSCSIDSIDVESKPWAILWLHMSRLPAIRGITSTWSPWMRNCTQAAPLDWQTLSEKPKLPEHVPVKASTWYPVGPVGPVGEYLHCLMVSPALGIPALQQVSRAWRKCALCGSIGVTLPAWMICLFGAEMCWVGCTPVGAQPSGDMGGSAQFSV